ncbi:hypothetical protein PQU92_08200 [Asticcacaulis sp. BYS171W]|uniref:Peptidase A2 domain-containing protein n=1 Tax=Asticcacaulis aquaticus TaxID=2984212 RepID=A0ABT5HTR4_9CAUL|nr:hypothetical protein [Asticcacaulis aquaticus]MDC7683255.1 hypothetical protein [Asticcacaulis aquaticus]
MISVKYIDRFKIPTEDRVAGHPSVVMAICSLNNLQTTVPAIGVVDGGASHIHIRSDLVKKLGLTAIGEAAGSSAAGDANLVKYRARIWIPGVPFQGDFDVYEEKNWGDRFPQDLLLGRDFLNHFKWDFDGGFYNNFVPKYSEPPRP